MELVIEALKMTTIPDKPIRIFPSYPRDLTADEITRRFRKLLGEFEAPSVPLELKVTEQIELAGGIVRERVEYAVEHDERVPAYHLYRKDISPDAPGLLSIHGHGGEQIFPHGKAWHCHPRLEDPVQYSYHAALAGFRVLAPDALCFGERQARWGYSTKFFDEVAAHAELTARGKSLAWKSVWDNSRAIEALELLGSRRIGVMGWSGGSIQSYILASVNRKVLAAVCFFSFITLRHQFGQYRCAHCLYPYIPGMMEAGLDWDQVISLIAPRKLFLGWGELDEGTPEVMYRSFLSAMERRIAKESLPPSIFTHVASRTGHEITKTMLQAALKFLHDHLSSAPMPVSKPTSQPCN